MKFGDQSGQNQEEKGYGAAVLLRSCPNIDWSWIGDVSDDWCWMVLTGDGQCWLVLDSI